MSRRRTEFEVEQQIFLGGQVSAKHQFFQTLAMLNPQFTLPYILLHNGKDLEKADTEEEFAEKMLYWIGIATNMQNYTELTRLSMILGDTRKRYDIGKIKDELPTPGT